MFSISNNLIILTDLKEKLKLVLFWTHKCINYIHTAPYLDDWHENYADEDSTIVEIYSPEFNLKRI
jgi:hypothetical protein